MIAAAAQTLPRLRQELGLFPAPSQRDGSPVWSLHDPAANRFYLITWAAFEILSRWQLGSTQAVITAVNRETTLQGDQQDVEALVSFLEGHYLTEPRGAATTERIIASRSSMRSSWWLWLVKNYLFFRVPLVRPQHFLDLIAPLAKVFFTPLFPALMLLMACGALVLVSRHWDQFIHSFTAFKSLEGLLALAITIPLAKIIHELGHACAAHRYGCKVPAMGIAFLVLTPMLYTDTNEAWKLSSRRQRLIIGSAGILAELALAVLATWAWLLLPDGPARGAAFFLATTAWIMTLALNASPFMRFDGYFILADLLSIPNLHPRSFAFGRWWLREALFGFGDPEPEAVTPGLRRFMILFALAVWLYRLVLFLGIALLVYHLFFKALGMVLFAVEIIWFIALPISSEIKVWLQRRSEICPSPALFRTVLLLIIGLVLLLVPWQSTVRAPAMLGAAREQKLVAPAAGRLVAYPADLQTKVKSGDPVVRLTSPDLTQRTAESLPSATLSRWQVNQQAFNEELLSQGKVLQKKLQGDAGILQSLKGEEERLLLRAPFDGTVVYKNDDVMPGSWVATREWVASVADLSRNRIDVYLEENDLKRISANNKATFIPDALEYGSFSCTVAEIDQVSITPLDDPSLASSFGGPIPTTQQENQHELTPVTPRYRVRLDHCTPAAVPPMRLRGIAHLEATRQSPALELLRHAWITLIRESGL